MSLTSRGERALSPADTSALLRVLALADDLSGAAETAAELRVPSRIVLDAAAPLPRARAVVVDLHSRRLPAEAAARAVRAALAAPRAPGTVLFKKVDSLLRGNFAAQALAYAAGARAVVIAPALPVAGRTVRDQVVHLNGVPLHVTAAWRAEPRPAPRSVTEALAIGAQATGHTPGAPGDGDGPAGTERQCTPSGLRTPPAASNDQYANDGAQAERHSAAAGLRTLPVPLATVRAGIGMLSQRLGAIAELGRHPLCDAETDADLDAIAAATLRLGSGFRLLGTGGLAGALGRLLGDAKARSAHTPETPSLPAPTGTAASGARPLLVVVGTAEPTAAAQIAQLVALGAWHVPLDPAALEDMTLPPAPIPLSPGAVTVISIDNSRSFRSSSAHHVASGLARTVAAQTPACDLVLTGGETARNVLDAVGVAELTPVGQVHHGAVRLRTPDGRSVVTRPGSYGGEDSLLRIARALRPDAGF
ncbi:four-carbon acid sugar kinase family protein [Streptomyces sp. NPDC058409]|uniref:four-carbon acid sugar kinase family protein n=1 Tax=Streptomyces sp. NPDC058409 TaxID=3346484 RepID=UPI00364C24BD